MAEIFDASKVAKIKVENVYKANEMTRDEFALSRLATSDEELFNTGAAALGDPHTDEYKSKASEVANKTLVAGTVGPTFEKKHIAALRLFGTNEYVNIAPGDSVIVKIDGTLDATAQVAYYLDQAAKFGFLKVTLSNESGEFSSVEASADTGSDKVVLAPAEGTQVIADDCADEGSKSEPAAEEATE